MENKNIVWHDHQLNKEERSAMKEQKPCILWFTGLSGSGKSSIAFDTIYAEGQRRYMETFSAYARQFLGRMDKPDVDYIEGLSPAISIEQKTTSRNPRSTVGTVTEIYDHLRLLYARLGTPGGRHRAASRQRPPDLSDPSFAALPKDFHDLPLRPGEGRNLL